MEDYNTTDPSQQINDLLGGSSGEPLIPESLTVFLIVCFVIINILTIVFLIFWVMGMVRRWKVQTAVLSMQKDIAEIKQSLAKPSPNDTTSDLQNSPNNTAAAPSEQNFNDSQEEASSTSS